MPSRLVDAGEKLGSCEDGMLIGKQVATKEVATTW